ncbi:MAG TPA: NDP-sugar synthase [Actinobacteria bacterium]|nr:NDP-sugar synthase [Actinomycetota bacterium]
MKAIILAGGQGTRLRPLTCKAPKPMLPLVNAPFLEYIFKLLKNYDVEEVILSTSYLPGLFERRFGDGEKYGLKLVYVEEKEPLGTAGAIKNVEEYLDDDPFVVFNGDILTNLNISQLFEYHRSKGALATLTLTSVEDPTSYGLVPINSTGEVAGFLEKPSWDEVTTDLVNAGTYILEPDVLNLIPMGENYSFERGVFPEMVEKKEKIFGFPSNAYWLDIGTPQKYLKAHRDILGGRIEFDFKGTQLKFGVWVGKNCAISSEANIFGPAVLGDNCQIEANATIFGYTTIGNNCMIGSGVTIGESVIFDDCRINRSSVIKNSILGKGVKLGAKVHVEDVAVLGEDIKIGDENSLKRGIRIWPETEIGKNIIKF